MYRVQLSQFDGPLDLLLHLIAQAEINIEEIFVSEITAQYLSYMGALSALELDTASEFLSMAAQLLYIKSRQLLPKPPREEPEEEEDPEQALIRQLRAYQAFKNAGAALGALRAEADKSLARLPADVLLPEKRITLDGATREGLLAAFAAVLSRSEAGETPPESHSVRPDLYTVRRQRRKIRALLAQTPRLPFETLFSEGADRMEIIVTFMTLLEMLAHGEIHVDQSAPFARITVRAKNLLPEDDEGYAYMDETED